MGNQIDELTDGCSACHGTGQRNFMDPKTGDLSSIQCGFCGGLGRIAITAQAAGVADEDTRTDRHLRQLRVSQWCAAAFGLDHASSVQQRGVRMLEEAIELAQACGVSIGMTFKLTNHIFSQPWGNIAQELGGVGITVLALAEAVGVSADACEQAELDRVLAKPLEHFTARNEAKNKLGFNTIDQAATKGGREDDMVVVERDAGGKPTIACDPEIVDIVTALNSGGVRTVASCSGHGFRPGGIALADGRWLIIAKDDAERQMIDGLFPLDINGDRMTPAPIQDLIDAAVNLENDDGSIPWLAWTSLQNAIKAVTGQSKLQPEDSPTNDQIAAVMLQHGTPKQKAEAMRYAGIKIGRKVSDEDIITTMMAIDQKHDLRVTELIEANNREVLRRRYAEARVAELEIQLKGSNDEETNKEEASQEKAREVCPGITAEFSLPSGPGDETEFTIKVPTTVTHFDSAGKLTHHMFSIQRLFMADGKLNLWIDNIGEPGHCVGCGLPYGDQHGFPDLIIPYESWKQIAPNGDDGGLLCPSCICYRLAKRGISCEGAFMSGPIQSVSSVEMSNLRRVENIELAIAGRDNNWAGVRDLQGPATPAGDPYDAKTGAGS